MINRKQEITKRALLTGTLVLFVLNIVSPVLALFPERTTVYDIRHSDSISDADMVIRVEFPQPIVSLGEDNEAVKISGDGWTHLSPPGSFAVPSRQIRALLPPGAAIKDIETTWELGETISRDVPLTETPLITYPGGPTSFTPAGSNLPPFDSISDPYIENAGIQFFRGYAIAQLTAYPICYITEHREIRFHSSVEIRIELEDNTLYDNSPMIRMGQTGLLDREELGSRGLHESEPSLEYISSMYMSAARRGIPSPGEYYQYVIITSSTLYDNFLPLAQWKTNRGIPTKVVNVSDITTDPDYNDIDTQAEIKNFIIDAYQNWNTEYVLLGGDTSVVPYRSLFGSIYVGYTEEDEIPCDLYYACLDGPYNNDGDGHWGESNDGAGGGDIDLIAEVYVGRAPVDTDTQADNFVAKIFDYEKNPRSGFAEKAVLSAAWLDASTDASLSCEDLETRTFPPGMASTKLYETLGNASVANFENALNDGVNIVYNGGHANWNVISLAEHVPYYNSDVGDLAADHEFHLFYTMGCIANSFERNDAFSEMMINDANGGSVVFIGNSRYGLYSPGNMLASPSHVFALEFFDKLFNEEVREAGRANQLGKEDLSGSVGNQYYRWIYFTVNYLGDPTMNVWFEEPEPLTVTHSPIMYTDSPAPVNVQVKDSGSQPVSNARVDVVNWPDFFSNDTTDANGNAWCRGRPP